MSSFHSLASVLFTHTCSGTFIKGHDDVGTESFLNRNGVFRTEEVFVSIKVRLELNPVIVDFNAVVEGINLKASRIS